MARTLDPVTHTVRRDAFIETASRLIQTKGYERMSVQDVLDDLDVSRGAFYHYFDSKEALLEAVVDRMAEAVIANVGAVLDDPDMRAPQKLELLFSTIGRYKAARRDLVLAILDVWLSADNAIVREKVRRGTVPRIAPVLVAIIRQGVREGSMAVDDADEAALVVVALFQGLSEQAGDLFVAHAAGMASIDAVVRTYGAFTSALERVLGLPIHSLKLIDEATLRWWFEPDEGAA